jgi:hypothetical protein
MLLPANISLVGITQQDIDDARGVLDALEKELHGRYQELITIPMDDELLDELNQFGINYRVEEVPGRYPETHVQQRIVIKIKDWEALNG